MERPKGLMNLENEKIEDLLKSLIYHKREILLHRSGELRHETQGVIESIQWEMGRRKRRMKKENEK